MKNDHNFVAPDDYDLYIFIIHGVEGYPEKNWYPKLKVRLEEIFAEAGIKIKIDIPQFPTKVREGIATSCDFGLTYENQTYENWKHIYYSKAKGIDPRKLMGVGHSLGGAFIAKIVAEAGEEGIPILAAFLVSAVGGHIDGLDPKCYAGLPSFYENLNGNYVAAGSDFIRVYCGKDDLDVPAEQTKNLAYRCGVGDENIVVIPDGKHLNDGTDPNIIAKFNENLAWDIVERAYKSLPNEVLCNCTPFEILQKSMSKSHESIMQEPKPLTL